MMTTSKVRRAVVLAHFDKDGIVDDYVVYYARRLREVCDHLVVVTTANPSAHELHKMDGICDQVIIRENAGYDFMSYKVGLDHLEWDYDEIVLCNDSVYGPFFPLSDVFEKMMSLKCEFWGMTESCDKGYHVQSYFLVFRAPALKSDYFKEFWDKLSIKNSKREIIDEYEVGLSRFLIKHGATAGAYSVYRPSYAELSKLRFRRMLRSMLSDGLSLQKFKKGGAKAVNLIEGLFSSDDTYKQKLNPTHFFWRRLIEKARMPFIKVELLRDNPENMPIGGWEEFVKSLSDYNTDYIKKHLERVKPAKSRT